MKRGSDPFCITYRLNWLEEHTVRQLLTERNQEKERRMAAQQGMNPIIAKLMKSGQGAFKAARTQKNPMAGINCPDGLYYGQMKRAKLGERKKKGSTETNPIVEFTIVLICCAATAETHDMQPGDQSYAGEQVRPYHTLAKSDNVTFEEACARLMYDFQDFGIETGTPGKELILAEQLREHPEQFTLEDTLTWLTENQFYCKVAISTDKTGQYRNANLRGSALKEDIDAVLGSDASQVAGEVVPEEEQYAEETQETSEESQGEASGEETQEGEEVAGEYTEVPDEEGEQLDGESEVEGEEETPFEPEPEPEPVAPAPRKAVAPKPPMPGRPAPVKAAPAKAAPAKVPVRPVAAPAKAPVKAAPTKAAQPAVKSVPGKKAPPPVKR